MAYRKATKEELGLLRHLINKVSLDVPCDWEKKIIVSPMNDGGMGSLSLKLGTFSTDNRVLGVLSSEYSFLDEDGIDVIASLYLDQEGNLFELDIWKTNFQPLIRIPKGF